MSMFYLQPYVLPIFHQNWAKSQNFGSKLDKFGNTMTQHILTILNRDFVFGLHFVTSSSRKL